MKSAKQSAKLGNRVSDLIQYLGEVILEYSGVKKMWLIFKKSAQAHNSGPFKWP